MGRRADDRFNEIRDELESLRLRVAAIESKPVDAAKVVFSGKAFLSACAIIASIIGGTYWLNGGARQDVRDIKFMLDERTKAQDKINIETKAAIEDVKRDIRATEERIKAEIRMKEYTKGTGRQP